MIPFSRNKHECEDCHAHFGSYDELVRHAQEAHRRHALKCAECGRLFLHEKDRLHHVKEERERKVDARRHKF
ncbi:hypothetical protein [Nitrososphaera sp.]|uniref:hypothetical protein n=1 Tax=Nitrososphaera sp. TaxID=1971748 RepID=UPI00307D9ECC